MTNLHQAGATAVASTRPWRWQLLEQGAGSSQTGYLVGTTVANGQYIRPGERLHHLFEQYCDGLGFWDARKRIAVEYPDAEYSFRELDRLANRIARYLKVQGVRAGDCVALLFDRSIYAHASVLAASKLGATYVPLDASFPADRIAYICEDAGVSTALTLSRFAELFAQAEVQSHALDAAQGDIDRMSARRLPSVVSPAASDSIAYIIYTSGSTGRPKGVSVWQSNICSFLRVATASYGYVSSDRIYQGMTMAFDYSVEELWVPLLCGATLVPAPGEVNLLGADLAEFIDSRNITAMCCVPTLLATIDRDLPALRFLMVSGEACPQDLADRWVTPGRRFLNTYGPTEATVTATWSVMTPGDTVCIGGPLPGYSIVILSPDSDEVLGQGEVGEIGIAGIGIAQGYVNLPEQTARAFVPDTVGLPDNPSGKIYRTGDLGRINEQHQIEYQGRIDQQVKIRGYRIELDEIAGVARGVPGVGQVAVNAYKPDSGGTELVVYYTSSGAGERVDAADLHREMKAVLPPFMVPAFIEPVAHIPMLPSGKVDRKSLPAPSGQRFMISGKGYTAPQTTLQQELADSLAKLLKIERVSVDADFFEELGANSLIIARYLSAVRKKLGAKKVSMKLIYQHPSIVELAQALGDSEQAADVNAANEATARVDGDSSAGNAVPLTGISATHGAGQPRPQLVRDPFYEAPRTAYLACGAGQLAYLLVMGVLATWLLIEMFRWVLGGSTPAGIFGRGIAAGWGTFAITALVMLGIKWLAVGCFKKQRIRLWSFAYFRFWVARTAIAANPMNVFLGSPVFNVYLRLLGAKIGPRSVYLSLPPVCTDLVSIGSDTIVRQDVFMSGYTARDGYLYCGPVAIGSRALVAEASVLEPNTVIHDDATLGTSSALHEGAEVPAGETWQGSPAEPSRTRFNRIRTLSLPGYRAVLYSVAQVALLLLMLPVPYLFAGYAWHGDITQMVQLPGGLTGEGTGSSFLEVAGWVAAVTAGGYIGALLLGHLSILTLPRIINRFIRSGQTHRLYGLQYVLSRLLTRTSHNQQLSRIYGDSSLITYFLSAVGYDLKESTQTGSNFGVNQLHHSPFLVKFRRNTLVSDGLVMLNMEVNNTSFQLSPVEFGNDNYLGNLLHWPAGARVGADCLIGTKAMVPIDGEVRSGVGILGSPPFEIPRSVVTDKQFEHFKEPSVLRQRLAMKLRSNLVTIALYMMRVWSQLFLVALGLVMLLPTLNSLLPQSGFIPAVILGGYALLTTLLVPAYIICYERLYLWFKPTRPLYCSLYDNRFWLHERYWKLNYNDWLIAFVGTPIKPFYTRLQGARVGRQVFDDGAGITEPELAEIGDFCCLNNHSSVQSHSLEDGTFKSDVIRIGARCSVAVRGFLHYGTEVNDDSLIQADAFVMKGSTVESGDTWIGNPAHDARSDVAAVVSPVAAPAGAADVPADASIGKAA